MNLQLDAVGPLYEQLARALKRAILEGRWHSGQRLPATRVLARQLGISRNTVTYAYELLCAQQLAVSRGGSGTRVRAGAAADRVRSPWHDNPAGRPLSRYARRARELGPIKLARRHRTLRYNLQYGEPLLDPPLFNSLRTKLSAAVLRTDPNYSSPAGLPSLRSAVCQYVSRRRGISCAPEDVIITHGTQQALSLVARVVLDEFDPVVLEDPHYQLALHALRAHGARIHPIRTDADGIVTADLPARGVRLAYVTPAYQFPSGAVMSFTRRMELLKWAAQTESWIFEDDYNGEFVFEGASLPTLRSLDTHDRVIYVGTFSKVMYPALRLGYIVSPARLRQDLVSAKLLDDLGTAALEQNALATFMENGGFDRHLRRAAAELRTRRTVLLEGLKRHAGEHIDVTNSVAGMHVVGWLRTLDYAGLDRLIEHAATKGLGLHPIHCFYEKPPPRPGLLLGFAGLWPAQLEVATRLLGRCLEEV
jgi:GntR family transcriptional regulator/MocR family aminotransferase